MDFRLLWKQARFIWPVIYFYFMPEDPKSDPAKPVTTPPQESPAPPAPPPMASVGTTAGTTLSAPTGPAKKPDIAGGFPKHPDDPPKPVLPETPKSGEESPKKPGHTGALSNANISDQATSQLIESLMRQSNIPGLNPVPPDTQPVTAAAPPVTPAAPKQTDSGKPKKSRKGIVLGLTILMLLITVPIGVYFVSQRARVTEPASQAHHVPKNSDIINFEANRKVKIWARNYFLKISLRDVSTDEQKFYIEGPPTGHPADTPWVSEWFDVPANPTQYKIVITVCQQDNHSDCEDNPAYGWRDPYQSNGRWYCGNGIDDGMAEVDVTDELNDANSQLQEPRLPMCWADAWIGDPTQDEDFNDFQVVLGYARPAVCTSATLTPTVMPVGGQVTFTLTGTPPAEASISAFMAAFYNLDNLYSPGNAKPIIFNGQHYTTQVCVRGSNDTLNTCVFTIRHADINKPDENWNNQIPKNISVTGYFTLTNGGFSVPDPKCIKHFTVGNAPTLTPTQTPSPTPTPTPPPQCQTIKAFRKEGTNYVDITNALRNGNSGTQPGDKIWLGANKGAGSRGARFRFTNEPSNTWHTTTTSISTQVGQFWGWEYTVPPGLTQETQFQVEAELLYIQPL
ncbi:hypothetical protein A2Z33_05325 [Candidatus Gottesmanbacteria bacterium RBG_16_52_11]|uniref:Uncharacterized protein n=1 Tax=Candidatus Gottesmanbacteria bacterium RBG_16_52_11 TaxID=1798374 RepID=A0A1F5YMC9_9BACT|nr:MAG: hypothetical protein A2Z33_05325 [Candidatus Gottesmanbacteria bacterium RBG_16_52_11]